MHDPSSHQHVARAAARVAPSLLRASLTQRLAIAAVFAVALWVAVAWALDFWTLGAAR